jgi:hypothetical protein
MRYSTVHCILHCKTINLAHWLYGDLPVAAHWSTLGIMQGLHCQWHG